MWASKLFSRGLRLGICAGQIARPPPVATSPFVAAQFSTVSRALQLNDLQFIPGSRRKRIRWGRGTGSGRGKLCGYGHQKSRSTPRGFEGGQTQLYKRFPKMGFKNFAKKKIAYLNLDKLQSWIDMGRLTPKPNSLITMRDLLHCGVLADCKDGVKLLANGKHLLSVPVHLEVSFASSEAIKAVEAAGGTVTCVHFNQLALRALLKPYKFEILPQRARPPPKIINYYLDQGKAGYLSPEVQTRNLKLFGAVTSEPALKTEHENFMNYRRHELRVYRESMLAKGIVDNSAMPKVF